MKRSMEIIGKIYSELFQTGLSKVSLSIKIMKIGDYKVEAKNREEWNSDNRLFEDLVDWLVKEEAIYIKAKCIDPLSGIVVFDEVQLSAKGLSVLNDLEGGKLLEYKSIASQGIVGHSQEYYTNLGEFVGSVLGGLTKSLGNV